jgi:hypothetical protein
LRSAIDNSKPPVWFPSERSPARQTAIKAALIAGTTEDGAACVGSVPDLIGAQIVAPTRQAATKRALIALLAGTGEGAAPHARGEEGS